MKWSMMLRASTLQMNLEPENDHERKAIDILREHAGTATLHHGVDVFKTQGGYLREFSDTGALAITITAEPTP